MVLLALLLSRSSPALPGDDVAWANLETHPVRVDCAHVGQEPWCRSEGIVAAPVQQVAAALADMRYSAHLFQSVLRIDVLKGDLLHVVLDYPTPLDDRDYVARYTHTTDGEAELYSWIPAEHPAAPVSDEAVRLPRFAGEWRLEPRGDRTWVRYTWQAEIAGSFPAFAYRQAWRRAGYEALKDLANTQKAALLAPDDGGG